MILHLLKTDWQRLRWPILGVWLLILISAIPWLFHSPESFTAPLWHQGSWNGGVKGLASSNDGSPLLRLISGITGFATFGLSTAIGILGVRWQGAMPLSRRKAVVAKLLSIFLFIVLPQLLLGALVMLVQRFPIPTIVSTGLGIALSLLLLHSVAACFARLCGSGWTWLAGVACLLGLTIVLNQLIPGSLFKPFYSDPLLSEKGPHLWALCSLALVAMFFLPRILRTQAGKPLAVTAALLAIVLASIATRQIPAAAILPSEQKIAPTSLEPISVAPVIDSVRRNDLVADKVRVSVIPTTVGDVPPDTFVVWTADTDTFDSPYHRIDPYPDTNSVTDRAALEPVLPAPLVPWPDGILHVDNSVSRTISHDELSAKTELSIPVEGHVFRYEQIADFALSENPLTQRSGPFTFAIRQLPDHESWLFFDLVIQAPEQALSKDGLKVSSPSLGAENFRIILFSPASGLCFQLAPELEQSARIPGGAQIIRRIFTPENQDAFKAVDRSGLRVLVYRPITLAKIQRTLTFATDVGRLLRWDTDWLRFRNYHLGLGAYLENHRPFRPDPEQATEAEVARYLRTISATLDDGSGRGGPGLSGRDLADYAPRFSELLTLHVRRDACAEAIEFGTPDAQRDEVFATLRDTPSAAGNLAPVLAHRGWLSEASDIFTRLLELRPASRGNRWSPQYAMIEALATLEDPETYPVLLKSLESSNSWSIYDVVRKLPGISPALDETIARMSRELSPAKELAGIRRDNYFEVFDVFRTTVGHGNPEALDKLLELWQLLPREDLRFGKIQRITGFIQPAPDIARTTEAWNTFLEGKTAADFTYDSLTHKWRASSASK